MTREKHVVYEQQVNWILFSQLPDPSNSLNLQILQEIKQEYACDQKYE